jgi:hypothetical protein
MEKSSQITWIIVPLRNLFPLKVVPLIEVLLYSNFTGGRYCIRLPSVQAVTPPLELAMIQRPYDIAFRLKQGSLWEQGERGVPAIARHSHLERRSARWFHPS